MRNNKTLKQEKKKLEKTRQQAKRLEDPKILTKAQKRYDKLKVHITEKRKKKLTPSKK